MINTAHLVAIVPIDMPRASPPHPSDPVPLILISRSAEPRNPIEAHQHRSFAIGQPAIHS